MEVYMAVPFEVVKDGLSSASSKPKEDSNAATAIPTRMYAPRGLSVPVTRQSSQAVRGPIKEVKALEKKKKGSFQEEYLSFSEKATKKLKTVSFAEEEKTEKKKEVKREQEEKIYTRKKEKEVVL